MDQLLSQSNPPLRQRRQRTNFNEAAIESLDIAFAKNPYPDINEREALAKVLSTTEDRIQVWYQNKRARYRKKMQKENIAKVPKKPSQKAAKPESYASTKALTPVASLDQSPIRPYNMKTSEHCNSTPISSYPQYKFNENKATRTHTHDSGYLSYNSYSSLNRSSLNPISDNSPSFISNVYSTPHSYSSSPYAQYYASYLPSMQAFFNESPQYSVPAIVKQSPVTPTSAPRVAKSIFRPF